MIKSNPVRKILQDGKPTIGTWVTLCPHPRIISLYAACGFDFVIIEMEHTDFSLDTVGPLLLTAREAGLTPFVRPPGTRDPHDLTRLLDSGAQGLVLPSIDTVEQIETILAATKFHPMGHRPLNLRGPHTDYISGDTDMMTKHLNAHTLSVVMIESQTGVANLADICAVDGVDAIMIGPDDLSQDMGIPGALEHPDLLAEARSLARLARGSQPQLERRDAPGIVRLEAHAGGRQPGLCALHASLLAPFRPRLGSMPQTNARRGDAFKLGAGRSARRSARCGARRRRVTSYAGRRPWSCRPRTRRRRT